MLPAEFMAAAERNDLLKNIDRWVDRRIADVRAQQAGSCLFVRLSKGYGARQVVAGVARQPAEGDARDPQRIVLPDHREIATEYLARSTELARGAATRGFRFALEHFGTGRDPGRCWRISRSTSSRSTAR